jgi:Cu2+-exporting ATPase
MFIETVIVSSALYGGDKLYRRVKKMLGMEEDNSNIIPFPQGSRTSQLKEISSDKREIEVSDEEKKANRYLAVALTSLGLSAAGYIYPVMGVISLPFLIYACWPFIQNAYRQLIKEGRIGMGILDVSFISACIVTGQFFPCALAFSFFHLGRKILKKTEDRSRKSLINIFDLQPRFVWLQKDGIEIEIPAEDLKKGDIVVVHAGEVIPIDGTIVQGIASIDQHILTGESQPADKETGDNVFASTLVLTGKICIRVEKTGEETTAASLARILNRTAGFKLDIQLRGEAIADSFALPTLLVAGLALIINGPLSAGVVLCACFALYMRLLAPMGMLNFLNIASRHSILIKDGRVLDLLNKVDTVVFDKTGTLTEEIPHIGQIYTLEGYRENDILMYAAAAEYKQTHPVAKAVLHEAKTRGIRAPEISDTEYKVGYGITVMTDGKTVRAGSARFMNAEGIVIPPEIEKINAEGYRQGYSLLMVAVNDKLAGILELHAALRPEAPAVIRELKSYAKSMYIISGDHEIPTRSLALKLGIDHYFAETLPENKAELIEELQKQGKFVCYVGDGINDSIALKKANVSVSLRGASTVATDTAQVILMDESLKQMVRLFELSRDFDKTMEAALVTTMIPGAIIIPGAFFLNFQIIHAVLLNQASLAVGTGIMMRPLLNWKKSENITQKRVSDPGKDTDGKTRRLGIAA